MTESGGHLHLVRVDHSEPDRVDALTSAPEAERPRVLLVGEVGSRPDGVERALIRAGYAVAEADGAARAGGEPDAILLTAGDDGAGMEELSRVPRLAPTGAPVLVVLHRGGREEIVRLLARGAADVLVSPVDLAELCARVGARVRAGRDAARARQATDQTSRLFDCFQDIAASLRPEEALHTLVRRLGDVLELSHCACVLWTPAQREGRLVALHEDPKVRDVLVDLAGYPEVTEAVRTAATVLVPDVTSHPLFLRAREAWRNHGLVPDVQSAAAIPLLRQDHPIGAVVLRTRLGEALRAEPLRFVERLVGGTARVLETQERRAAISRRQGVLDVRDPLTGCASLDMLDRRLHEEVERARRYGLSFSLVLLDVEGLALVNQRYGTAVGDRALADLGALLQREIRGPDFVARYGGDEFALVLPETSQEGAARSVRRVRARVSQHPFADLRSAERPQLTAGIVTFPHPSVVHPEDLFALVEAALLRGKTEGGERIGTAA